MTLKLQFWLSIIREAQNPGVAWIPDELLRRIRPHDQPLRAIGHWDKANWIFSGLEEAAGFINIWRVSGLQPKQADCDRWTQLFRWLIQGLLSWRRDQDPTYHNLTALFVVAQYCYFENGLWEALPPDVGGNIDLLDSVTKLIASLSCEFKTHNAQAVPIWEQEAIDQFQAADAKENWLGVDELWNSIEPAMIAHALQGQLIRYLGHFNRDKLGEATRHVAQFTVAMHIANALAPSERLEVGLATTNSRLKFACVYSIWHLQRQRTLNSKERDLLSSLLLQITANNINWLKWMAVFNRHPLRYPGLQPALGRALAVACESALQSYIDSIKLSLDRQGSRDTVAVCLAEFRAIATQRQQQLLWTMAFCRWSSWNFDEANPEQHAFQIGWSELDYAVVSYAVDCLDAGARAQAQKDIFDRLSVLDNQWHDSVTDCITAFNRLLSALQPYAHAATVAANGRTTSQDLLPLKLYLPSEVQNNRYLRLMYSVR